MSFFDIFRNIFNGHSVIVFILQITSGLEYNLRTEFRIYFMYNSALQSLPKRKHSIFVTRICHGRNIVLHFLIAFDNLHCRF